MQKTEYTKKILESIGIPSQPLFLLSLQEEFSKKVPDFHNIINIVEKDVSLSARLIRVANSPFFAGGRIETIEQALRMVGIDNFYSIILAAALKEAMSEKDLDKEFFEFFWSHTELMAAACAYIARRTRSAPEGYAYMTGLFHDCAVPLLIKRFDGYLKVFRLALRLNYPVVEIENDIYKTDHCIAGFVIATSWHLPKPVSYAIKYHHYPDIDIYESPEIRKLASTLILAETIVYAGSMQQNAGNFEIEPSWGRTLDSFLMNNPIDFDSRWAKIMSDLGIDEEDVFSIREKVFEIITR
ncbi:MAG: HDOD domain-containing protein [Candidatus Magnetoovum sp. WYHC-5]|nr:HDOD domain-containing protein [Candidatus Magnetoovum sp. WYHC-5]